MLTLSRKVDECEPLDDGAFACLPLQEAIMDKSYVQVGARRVFSST
jgi:hypothetical protein